MAHKLDKLTIRGFKSIASVEGLELGQLNVLIGANGAGKSNFVEFFGVLRALIEQRFQSYMEGHRPTDGYFFNGVSETKEIEVDLRFGRNRYVFSLKPTDDGGIMLGEERTQYLQGGGLRVISSGGRDSVLRNRIDDTPVTTEMGVSKAKHGVNYYVWESVSNWQVYHFHDTSMTAGMRRPVGTEQCDRLQSDGSNLAAFLLNMRKGHASAYELLEKTIRRIAPYFDHFDLRVEEGATEDFVRLRWRQQGTNYVFSPGHFSDGTIRFICLATVLMQPEPPATVILDEPELGLHPEALEVLGGLLRSASTRMQIIVATQSPVLLNQFEAEQVITVDHVNGRSCFTRLNEDALSSWLNDYTLGDLWEKGTIQGGVNNA